MHIQTILSLNAIGFFFVFFSHNRTSFRVNAFKSNLFSNCLSGPFGLNSLYYSVNLVQKLLRQSLDLTLNENWTHLKLCEFSWKFSNSNDQLKYFSRFRFFVYYLFQPMPCVEVEEKRKRNPWPIKMSIKFVLHFNKSILLPFDRDYMNDFAFRNKILYLFIEGRSSER